MGIPQEVRYKQLTDASHLAKLHRKRFDYSFFQEALGVDGACWLMEHGVIKLIMPDVPAQSAMYELDAVRIEELLAWLDGERK